MKEKVLALSILLLLVFLATGCSSKVSQWNRLEQRLNPNKKTMVIIAGREVGEVFAKKVKRSGTLCVGVGYGFLLNPYSSHYKRDCFTYQSFIHSDYPLIVLFSPDQINISLDKLPEEYHFLSVIGIEKVRRILDQGKCLIVSKWEKEKEIKVGHIPLGKDESMPLYLIRGERYLTLIAAPNEKLLLKAIVRFFGLKEIPVEPIIF